MKKIFIFIFLALCFLSNPALSGEKETHDQVKIGFVTTLTGSAALIGEDMKFGAELALEHLKGRMGELDVSIIYEDDESKPEIGKQVTDKLVQWDNVDFVTGFIWSHVLLASRRSVLNAGNFLISANAGPSQMAGKMCHDNFFSVSWQGDQMSMAIGEVLNKKGIKNIYMMAPNYTAGKDMISGFLRVFKGQVMGIDQTKWGGVPQLDFSAEFAKVRSSGADALWAFYPGKSNFSFLNQYEQSGLAEHIPLYTVFVFDATTLPRMQEAGLKSVPGSLFPQFWDPTLNIPANNVFVTDFRAKHNRYPSFYAAQSYDAINLINLAVTSVKGDLTDREGMRMAMETADFPSVRGKFRFGRNHFPIQNFYLRKIVTDKESNWTSEVVETIFIDHQDPYVDACLR